MKMVIQCWCRRDGQQGSLALEQVLFIGAVVAMGAGLWAFYNNMGDYFTNFQVQGPSGTGQGGGGTP